MREVPITTWGNKPTGEYFLVDDADYLYVSKFRWHISDEGYVERTAGSRYIKLHRLLEHSESHTRHGDGNKLNNQRNNLIPCGSSEKQLRSGLSKNNTSGYRGVTFNRKKKLWQAQIGLGYKNKYLGCYSSPEEASQVYEKEREKYLWHSTI